MEYINMFNLFYYRNQPQIHSPLIYSLHRADGEIIMIVFYSWLLTRKTATSPTEPSKANVTEREIPSVFTYGWQQWSLFCFVYHPVLSPERSLAVTSNQMFILVRCFAHTLYLFFFYSSGNIALDLFAALATEIYCFINVF